jgi:hypothetical protein
MPESREHVEPRFRCGRPAERPVVACGHVGGRDGERLPLCVNCWQVLLEDVRRFGDGLATATADSGRTARARSPYTMRSRGQAPRSHR